MFRFFMGFARFDAVHSNGAVMPNDFLYDVRVTPWKTNMRMGKQPVEDVSPNKNGDFPASHVSFRGGGGGKALKPMEFLTWEKVADLHSIIFIRTNSPWLEWDSMLPSAHLAPEIRKISCSPKI